jgi:transglutaminase-like putative cysteine protease
LPEYKRDKFSLISFFCQNIRKKYAKIESNKIKWVKNMRSIFASKDREDIVYRRTLLALIIACLIMMGVLIHLISETGTPSLKEIGALTGLTQGDYNIHSKTTQNSQIKLTAHLKADKKVWIIAEKNGIKSDDLYISKDKSLNQILYLRLGPGKYTLTFYEKDVYDLEGVYRAVKRTKVINKDENEQLYLMPSSLVNSDDPEISKLAKQITKNMSDPYEKTKMIHDLVTTMVEYDVKNLNLGNVKMYSASETLETGIAMCTGYANLVAALNRAIGIPARVVTGEAISEDEEFAGESSNHAWVETFVDNRWVVQDPTWDSGAISKSENVFIPWYSDEYFDMTEAEFAKDHRVDEKEY